MIKIVRVALFVGLLLSFAVPAFPQGVGVGVGPNGPKLSGFGDVDIEKTIEHWIATNLEDISPQMDLQIAQIADVCELSDSDAARLRIAVKGVVQRRVESGRQQISDFIYSSGLAQRESDTDQSVEVEDANKIVVFAAGIAEPGVVNLSTYFVQPLVAHPLWSKTIEKTLSSEQLEKYTSYRIKRSRQLLNSAIDSWVVSIDSQVFLRQEQKKSITTHLQQQLESHVTVESPRTLIEASEFVAKKFSNVVSLGELLDSKQTEVRKMLLRPKTQGSSVSWGRARK